MKQDISLYDKNFAVRERAEDGREWLRLDARSPLFTLSGLLYDEERGNFVRLPAEARAISDGIRCHSYHTAGGCLRFRTDAASLALDINWGIKSDMHHMPQSGSTGFDLYAFGEDGRWHYRQTFIPNWDVAPSMKTDEKPLAGKMTDYCLNFPLYNELKSLTVLLSGDAAIEPARRFTYETPVVFYGSSITQGGCASRPGNCYDARLSRRFDFNRVNLGFSGNAKGELAMADYIASLPHSVFVMDYDHNSNPDELAERHEAFFRRYREKRPDTPVILVSSPYFFYDRADRYDGRNVETIRKTYANALAAGDRNVWFVNGGGVRDVVGEDGSVDGCHPNDLGFYAMEQLIAPAMAEALTRAAEQKKG